MGYQYEPLHVEPIDEREVELIVGRQPQRSLARKVIRVGLTVGLAFVLLHAYHGAARHPSLHNKSFTDGELKPTWIDSVDRGELVKCFREEASEPERGSEDHPVHDHEWKFVTLPAFTLDAESLYFFADGPPKEHHHHHRGATFGEIIFTVSDEAEDITVQAEIGYKRRLISDVCTFKREDGALGVGVVIPPKDHDHDHDHDHDKEGHDEPHHPHHPHHPGRRHPVENNRVKLVIGLPKSKAPLHLKSLETHLPLYRHAFGDLGDVLQIDSLDLKSANAPIEAGSVNTNVATVKTINSIIAGSFNATNSLSIITANAPIDVKVALTSRLKEDEGPAELTLRTVNANLKAVITLATASDDISGDFLVETITSNAPVGVIIDSTPVGSKLEYTARSVNGPVDVALPASYEGVFRLSTVIFRPDVKTSDDVEDPAGRGRQRNVVFSTVGRSGLEGEVYWGEKGEDTPSGSVDIRTSMAPISLVL